MKRRSKKAWPPARLLITFVLLAGLTLMMLPCSSQAAFPGVNGKILFYSDRDGDYEIYVMNSDGSNVTRLTNHPAPDTPISWSPDGTKILFVSDRDGPEEIYIMNPDGTGQTNLTNDSARDTSPDWSPDGTTIAFMSNREGNFQIYVMNADGSGVTRLTFNSAEDGGPRWSPDGTNIVFTSDRDGFKRQIYVMNTDGSQQTRLTFNTADDINPDWQPIPVIQVSMDIKPGIDPNSINPRSRGKIPVAILTGGSFDATSVDETTVLFGATGTEAAPAHSALEDVDGDTDKILHFNTQDTGIACGDTSASLTGETFGGLTIEGSDSIKTVGCK